MGRLSAALDNAERTAVREADDANLQGEAREAHIRQARKAARTAVYEQLAADRGQVRQNGNS